MLVHTSYVQVVHFLNCRYLLDIRNYASCIQVVFIENSLKLEYITEQFRRKADLPREHEGMCPTETECNCVG